jgi:predicted nucleotidyltransferase
MISSSRLGIDDLLKGKREEILKIAQRHGAYNVRVFGSVARSEATETSDVDLLIDYDSSKRSAWFPTGLMLELETLLKRKVDIATVSMLKERIRDQVLAEAVPL